MREFEQRGLAVVPLAVDADSERPARAHRRHGYHLRPRHQAQMIALQVLDGLVFDAGYAIPSNLVSSPATARNCGGIDRSRAPVLQ